MRPLILTSPSPKSNQTLPSKNQVSNKESFSLDVWNSNTDQSINSVKTSMKNILIKP
jgi:hypothetical protein